MKIIRSIGIQILIIIVFVANPCCSQNGSKRIDKPKLTTQDSLKVVKFLDKGSQFSLFSMKRQKYLDSALAIVPWASNLWQQKAMPLFKQKKYEIGMRYLDSAVKYDKSKHWLEYRAFIKCIFQRSYRAAIKDFNMAQNESGNSYVMDHSYEFFKGLCYLQLNEIDSAEYLMEKVISEELKTSKEAHHLHWFYLGVIQYEKEDYKNATISLDSSLHRYSQFSDAQYYKAMCFDKQKLTKQALDLMLKASENLSIGYTINEDNAIYESYPYQINKFFVTKNIELLQK